MLDLHGYIIRKKIYEDEKISVYCGIKLKDRMSVIIKALKQEAINKENLSGLINEFDITRNLKIKGILKPIELKKVENTFAMIVEDIKAVPIRKYMKDNAVDIPLFLDLAIQLVRTVAEVHQNGIIHGNINPDSILIQPANREVILIDFSNAAFLSDISDGTSRIYKGDAIEYVSLERLGLAEGIVDYRSDYYSTGVVFYELLTGQLPYQAKDEAEWVHACITTKPVTPEKLNPKIPSALAAIVMKMISKPADERYQSAYGILKDLENCRIQWNTKGRIVPFVLGQKDISPRFMLTQRIIGRETETKNLISVFDRTCSGQGEFVIVNGYAGTGKTVLINKVLKPLAVKKGYYAYGKFDQLRQNIPYAAISDALRMVIKQIMTESVEQLKKWKSKISAALKKNGAVITQLIPELEMIIGPQDPVKQLDPIEAQNRFLMVFGNFINALADKSHPLVLVLDDLHWADINSLQLLKYMCRDSEMSHLLIVGCFRDTEVCESHPLWLTLKEICREDIQVSEIKLNPLSRENIAEYIAETLHCPDKSIDRLVEVLYRRAYGNPFFLSQLLKSVYKENLFTFNMIKGCWEWEENQIQKIQMPEDVIDLILFKLRKLPQNTINILKLASCMGNTFDLGLLEVVCDKTQDEISYILMPALKEDLIVPVSLSGQALMALDKITSSQIYEFIHDRVKQAVYSLLLQTEKKKLHVKIGYSMLRDLGQDGLGNKILTVMDHLNRGLEFITDNAERLKFAQYNLIAGRKVKASVAYDLAMEYFLSGISLLPENPWNSCFNLCYDLYLERAQCEYMLGNVDDAEKLFDIMLLKAKDVFQKSDIYGMKMMLYAGTGKHAEAVKIGIHALQKFGIKIPSRPSMFENIKGLLLYRWLMYNKKPESLLNQKEMTSPVHKKVADLLIKFIFVTCTNYPDLYGLSIIKAGNYAAKHGNSEMASIGYLGYSIVEGSVLGNYLRGYQLGNVAVTLAEKYDNSLSKCVAYFTFGAIISHWTHHAKEGLKYLHKAVEHSFEAGDVLISGFSRGVILENMYLIGTHLGDVIKEAESCIDYAKKVKHENLLINAEVYLRAAAILAGSSNKSNFACCAESLLKSVKGDLAALAAYYFSEMQLSYLFENYHSALAAANKINKCRGAIMGFLLSADYVFYHSLTIAAAFNQMPAKEKFLYMRALKKNQRRMYKWSDSCPENFLHKYLLVEAERLRINDKKREAEIMYDKSIKCARENGYINVEAIAYESASRFYMNEGRLEIAKTYMHEAVVLYKKLGAEAKLRALKEKYFELLEGFEPSLNNVDAQNDPIELLRDIVYNIDKSRNNEADGFDIHTVKKALKGFSTNSEQEKLLDKFVRTAIESTSANRGFLILEKDGELFIEVMREGDEYGVVENKLNLDEIDTIPKRMVRYVARTGETIVINSKNQIGIFLKDSYLSKAGVKSLACIPLKFNSFPLRVLYLENSFMTGVFTEERIELVILLAGLMIYSDVQHSVNERGHLKDEEYLFLTYTLTKREIEVINLIAAGLSNKEIARKLDLTVNTVKTHIKNLYGKLQVNNRVQAVEKAKELNIM
ncbi:MAG: AAA family ATPase [Tepidanaerobacteraceae bacterium]